MPCVCHDRIFICLKNNIVYFTRPSVFYWNYGLWVVLEINHVMIIMMNAYCWKICNSHTHILPCIMQSSSWVVVVIYWEAYNNVLWYYYLNLVLPWFHPLMVYLPLYYLVIVQKKLITIMEPSVCQIFH